jgi:hypothetical protein
MGKIHFLRRKYKDAEKYFKSATLVNTNHPELHFAFNGLGLTYLYQSDVNISAAVNAFSDALALSPYNIEYFSNLLTSRRTVCYWKDYEEIALRIYSYTATGWSPTINGIITPYNSILLPFSPLWKKVRYLLFLEKFSAFLMKALSVYRK